MRDMYQQRVLKMTLNPYINSGSFYSEENEQNLIQDLIIESIQMWGNEMLYLPRRLVSKDEILGEDLSFLSH